MNASRRISRFVAVWLCSVALLLASCDRERPGSAVRRALGQAALRGELSGAVGVVARNDALVSFEAVGFADRESQTPMARNTLFRIASMTKPVTSVALLMLHERRGFSLDAPASDFLPELGSLRVLAGDGSRRTLPAATSVTLRHLLAHTAGFGYRMQGREPLSSWYAEAGVTDGLVVSDLSLADNVQRLARVPLLHQPGDAFTYGLSTDVVGRLVEVISGQELDAFLQTHVFEPLGMHDTSFRVSPERRSRLARVYHWSAAAGLEPLADARVDRGHLSFSPDACFHPAQRYLSGGAGLVSTASDYLRFARMLARGGELDGVRLLRSETVAQMTQNQIGRHRLPGGATFGLGVSIVEQKADARSPGSFGWQGFYHTEFWVDPRHGLVGVFLSQLRFEGEVSSADDFVAAAYRDAGVR